MSEQNARPVASARRIITASSAPAAPVAAPGGATPWARQTGRTEERTTPRARRMVQGLPGWEPLPPGELLVRRPTSS